MALPVVLTRPRARGGGRRPKVLAVDVGGTHVKVLATGHRTPRKIRSGPTMTAREMVAAVKRLVADWQYDVVSIGYPGVCVHGRPIAELASRLDSLQGPLRIERTAARRGDVRESVADLAAARAALGFEPAVDLETGLRRTLEAFSGGKRRGAARPGASPAGHPIREVSQ